MRQFESKIDTPKALANVEARFWNAEGVGECQPRVRACENPGTKR